MFMPFVHSIHSLHMRVINALIEAWLNFLKSLLLVYLSISRLLFLMKELRILSLIKIIIYCLL